MNQSRTGNTEALRWGITFLILIAGFHYFSTSNLFLEVINPALVSVQIAGSSLVLKLAGFEHTIVHNVIQAGSRQFVVADSCSGLFVFFLFASAVMAFPTRLIRKIQGLVSGFAVLLSINILRICLIVTVSSRFPQSFWSFHIIAGQVLIISSMSLIFLVWLYRLNDNTTLREMLTRYGIIRFVLLFAAGYGLGYGLYILFLRSGPGQFITRMIQDHTHNILSLLSHGPGTLLGFKGMPHITFIPECLSSPIFVILFAIVFAWPCSWKRRILIGLLGFMPVFYLYHLIRSLTIASSFAMGASRDHSLMYNCYGQIVISLVGIACLKIHLGLATPGAYCTWGKKTAALGTGMVLGCLTSLAMGRILYSSVLPWILTLVKDQGTGYYDPQMTVSTMAYFQCFIFNFLVWSDAPLSPWRKLAASTAGTLILAATMLAMVAGIEALGLTPHTGILKGIVIILPFFVYLGLRGPVTP
ncbi:MAG: exosortase/archaeosortase family protein [Pseudomonadota bacterium]